MLERLKEALAECLADKSVVEACDFEKEIQEEIAEAEAQIRAKYESKKAAGLLEVSYQIKALESLISKEEKKLAAEQAINSAPEQVNEFPAEETAI